MGLILKGTISKGPPFSEMKLPIGSMGSYGIFYLHGSC